MTEPTQYQVRAALASESKVIFQLLCDAFGQKNEAKLLEVLKAEDDFRSEMSMVLVFNEIIIGYIYYCPISIHSVDQSKFHNSLALAPMAITPRFQGKGLGLLLLKQSLKIVQQHGGKSVIVLGHPHFYRKVGFKSASNFNITPPFDVPKEAFMALELIPKALDEVTGVVKYPPAFNSV